MSFKCLSSLVQMLFKSRSNECANARSNVQMSVVSDTVRKTKKEAKNGEAIS